MTTHAGPLPQVQVQRLSAVDRKHEPDEEGRGGHRRSEDQQMTTPKRAAREHRSRYARSPHDVTERVDQEDPDEPHRPVVEHRVGVPEVVPVRAAMQVRLEQRELEERPQQERVDGEGKAQP
jgi:hypothetical protein